MTMLENAIEVVRMIRDNYFEAYFVGGYVRDFLMNKDPKDIDITTNARPEQIQKIFKSHVDTGLQHGTVSVRPNKDSELFEVTTYRVDGKYNDGRHPSEVIFTPSLNKDLERRDFTMNAIAMDPTNWSLIDPFHGYDDIQNKIVRCVGDAKQRFMEDPLRVLRAMRFAIKYGFTIEDSTKAAMHDKEILDKLEKCISKERITDELRKMLTCGNPIRDIFMEFSDIIGVIIPEMIPCIGAPHNSKWHPHDIYDHILHVVDGCKTTKFEIKLAALLHDIGKPNAREHDEELNVDHFHGHQLISFDISKVVFDNDLRVSTKERELILNLILHHDDKIGSEFKFIRRFIVNNGEDFARDWIILKSSDLADHIFPEDKKSEWEKDINDFEFFKAHLDDVIAQENAFKITDLEINGKDVIETLNISPGPRIGEILKATFNAVIDELITNDRETLLKFIKTL